MNEFQREKALYIGGRWVPGGGGDLEVENPATEELTGVVSQASAGDVDTAVAAARAAFPAWAGTPAVERAALLRSLRGVIAERAELIRRHGAPRAGFPTSGGARAACRHAARGHRRGGPRARTLRLPQRDRQLGHPASTGRGRGRHHAVEPAAAPGRGEGDSGAGRRGDGRAETGRTHPAHRVRARPRHRRGRAARWRVQPGAGQWARGR